MLAGGKVARTAGEQGQAAAEASEERLRRKRLRAGRGQLDGEGKAIEPGANLGDNVLVVWAERERGIDGNGPLTEQLDRIGDVRRER